MWADRILQDYEVMTGYPLAHQWQIEHGRLLDGKRLLPITPFLCGGSFDISNLYACDALEGMRLRGELSKQLSKLPDGAEMRIRVH